MATEGKQKTPRRGAKKITAKAKSTGKKAGLKRKAARKPAARRRPVRETQAVLGSQSVPTVPLKRRARTAAAGAGGGDFGGVSVVEGADSESAEELLEEGQTFEAGIGRGVGGAPGAGRGGGGTHQGPPDDVPEEEDDKNPPEKPSFSQADSPHSRASGKE